MSRPSPPSRLSVLRPALERGRRLARPSSASAPGTAVELVGRRAAAERAARAEPPSTSSTPGTDMVVLARFAVAARAAWEVDRHRGRCGPRRSPSSKPAFAVEARPRRSRRTAGPRLAPCCRGCRRWRRRAGRPRRRRRGACRPPGPPSRLVVVEAAATVEDVRAAEAGDHVGARAAVELVGAGAAGQNGRRTSVPLDLLDVGAVTLSRLGSRRRRSRRRRASTVTAAGLGLVVDRCRPRSPPVSVSAVVAWLVSKRSVSVAAELGCRSRRRRRSCRCPPRPRRCSSAPAPSSTSAPAPPRTTSGSLPNDGADLVVVVAAVERVGAAVALDGVGAGPRRRSCRPRSTLRSTSSPPRPLQVWPPSQPRVQGVRGRRRRSSVDALRSPF